MRSGEALAPFGERARVEAGDFDHADLGAGYRAVVSRLAVHHLDDSRKQVLYRRVFEALLPGGVFVNSDMVRGTTEERHAALMAEWRDYMTGRGDDPDRWVDWLAGDDDYPATIEEQSGWLVAAGFEGVSVLWERAGFAMIRAVRAR